MNISFLRDNGSKRLILIFTGWSTGPELYDTLDIPDWDMAVVHGFSGAAPDFSDLSRYDTVYLFAWSLGVWSADRLLDPGIVTKAFAINGTVNPVSDDAGIPCEIFRKTAETLNPKNLGKFRRRMMPDAASWKEKFPEAASDEQVAGFARELFDIMTATDSRTRPRLAWTRAYIGAHDLIFPPANMQRAWEASEVTEIVVTEGYHYCDMASIIRGVIADTRKVSERFAKAAATYDSHAVAQETIATHLAAVMRRHIAGGIKWLAEIGPGTGFLTRAYARFLSPDRADFVDITHTGPFGVAKEENYYVEDAEKWISSRSGEYDLIVSSSAIQWFADIPRFLRHCAKALKPGGWLAIATFAPGNLFELDALRPSPLLYPELRQLEDWLSSDFDILHTEANMMRMEFESRRHLLLHLKHTGVAGNGTASSTSTSAPADIRTLTYRPIYLLARKR